jgi:hypothetical protein
MKADKTDAAQGPKTFSRVLGEMVWVMMQSVAEPSAFLPRRS